MNPLRTLLDRCSRGFTMPRKSGITIAAVLWVVSPLDLDWIPILGWIDDVFAITLIRPVWAGPTLPLPTAGGASIRSNTDAEPARESQSACNGLAHRPMAGSKA